MNLNISEKERICDKIIVPDSGIVTDLLNRLKAV